MAKNKQELLIAFGGQIKALGDGKVGGLLVRYTDPTDLDLEGEFFDAETDYDIEDGDPVTVYYAHGLDPKLKGKKLGRGKGVVSKQEIGLWVQAQLDLRDEYETAIYDMVKADKLGWSSGSLAHLVERVPMGQGVWLKSWPIGKDASLTPTPAAGPTNTRVVPLKSITNFDLKVDDPKDPGKGSKVATTAGSDIRTVENTEENLMTEPTAEAIADIVAKAIEANNKIQADAVKAEELRLAEAEARDLEIAQKAYAEGVAAGEKDTKASNDPGINMPYVAKFNDAWQYDNYPAGDLAATLAIVGEAQNRPSDQLVRSDASRPEMIKALALRLESDEANDEETKAVSATAKVTIPGPLKVASNYMKGLGVKANETNFSTNASFGDEWIGVAYGGQLWQSVRNESDVVGRIPSFEFPAGAESMVIPLESTDPIWYLVAQAGDPTSATAQMTNTVPAKALGTLNKSMTLSKLGSSTLYTGEMVEDSVLPFVAQLRVQIGKSAAEYLASAIIDGDSDATTVTNINDIAGTPASTDWFLAFNGFRKSALITTTANSRDAGVLTTSDFLETVKLMGAAGKVGFDRNAVSFLIDPWVNWKALELADVKTRDVNSQATVEAGLLTRVYGYDVAVSFQLGFSGYAVNGAYAGKTNAAGKVDIDTDSNNTVGSMVAVRWDHWRLGNRRALTTEVMRIPRADGWEITSLMRAGLAQRDTEASAVSYNITV